MYGVLICIGLLAILLLMVMRMGYSDTGEYDTCLLYTSILNRLVNGSASTFNKQTNVRLDNKYTVLDISSLTGDLLTVGMFVACLLYTSRCV